MIAEWIKDARKRAGLSGEGLGMKLSLAMGTSRGYTKANISHWETEKHSPNLQQLLAIAKVTGRSLPDEIIRGLGGVVDPAKAFPGAMRVVVADEDNPGFVPIPLVKLKLSAGVTGFQTEPEYHDGSTVGMSREWIRRKGFDPTKLLATVVGGRSMEPTLYDGDVVVINTADTKPVSGKVFAVNFDGEAVVKRMQWDGKWWLASDNPDQRTYFRRACEGASCLIVGRVVHRESDEI